MIIAAFLFLIGGSVHAAEPSKITVPDVLLESLKSFEPSGALYLADLDLYLLASDDTDKKDKPLLFLMDDKGVVEESPLKIKGIKRLADIESLSQDDKGTLYILSSLGLNKNGNNLTERNMFIRAIRTGRDIEVTDAVELRSVLLEALDKSKDVGLQAVAKRLEDELDVESHFVLNGELFVGLKGPQPKHGEALILQLGPVEDIFANEAIDDAHLKVWANIDFTVKADASQMLSEMLRVGNDLFLLSSTETGDGRLWKYETKSGVLTSLREFKGSKPEGLAYRADRKELLITFDQGDGAALFVLEPVH